MERRVIALIGQRYCGKTTTAELVCQTDSRFHRASFGSVLRKEYSARAGVEISKLTAAASKEKHRQAMINESKEVKSLKGEDYYARKLFESVPSGQFIVIDDLRFIEELKLCLENRAAIFRVHAEPHHRAQRGFFPSTADQDTSETELNFLSGYDLWRLTAGRGGMIFNTRDTNYLRSQVIRSLYNCFSPVSQYKEMMTGMV